MTVCKLYVQLQFISQFGMNKISCFVGRFVGQDFKKIHPKLTEVRPG
jgi:hypothetical protein